MHGGVDAIQGIWTVISYEENGVWRSNEALHEMANLLILTEKMISGSDGIWGVVKYYCPRTPDIIEQSIQSLKKLISGRNHEKSGNFHIYTGGILHIGSEQGIGSIDMVVYVGPLSFSESAAFSTNRGIFRYDGRNLTLCLCDSKVKQRPMDFDSTRSPHQSVAIYARA